MISILDYQMGNIQSVVRKLQRLGASVQVISRPEEVIAAEKLILPGVGHFGKAMAYLHETGLIEALNKAVLEKKVPVLGICLGMQLMCTYSQEGDRNGLGWFDARVTRIQPTNQLRYKVPHTGWNAVQVNGSQPLFQQIEQAEEFYFVHAYHVQSAPPEIVMTTTFYETPFVSGLCKDHIMGVQFHPEKSHVVGDQLIKNFIQY
jgi:glutamine amidotransferase